MFFRNKDKNTNLVTIDIPCECGIHSMRIEYFDDSKDDLYFSFFVRCGYIQEGIFRTIASRIKQAFLILFGKGFRLQEIVMKREDAKKLQEEIANLLYGEEDD